MAYRIVLTEAAIEDLDLLDARRRAKVRDALTIHLTHEPTKQSKSRIKRLRDLTYPQFRLRVDDTRVFYNVKGKDVIVVAVMPKERSIQWLEEHGKK